MKITNLAWRVVLAAAIWAGVANAGSDQAGTTSANFLSVGSSPDILGRAGATLGLRGDIGAVEWNAGALGFLRETQISLAHATLLEDHAQEYAAAGGRMFGSDMRWSLSGLYESQGSFQGRDAFNNPTSDFNVSSMAAGGHVAYPIAGIVAVGAGAKWVNENLGTSRGAGMTFDAGLQLHAGMLGVGFAAQNFMGKMRFGNSSYDFPTNYGVGVALDHAETGLRVALDANFPSAYYSDVRAGLEWRWRDLIALRGGYRSELGGASDETLSGPSFGFGAGVYGMWLDYGYIVPGSGGAQHRLGVTLRPGRMNFGGGAVGELDPPAIAAPRPTKAAPPRKPIHATAAPQSEPAGQASATAPAQAQAQLPTPVQSVPVQTPPPAQVQPVQTPPPPPLVATQPTAQQVQPATAQPAAAVAEALKDQAKPQHKQKKHKERKPKVEKSKAKVAAPESDDPFEAIIERAKRMNPGDPSIK